MAEMILKVKVMDMPEVMATIARIKKIQRRRAWVHKTKTKKARNGRWSM